MFGEDVKSASTCVDPQKKNAKLITIRLAPQLFAMKGVWRFRHAQ